MDYDYNDRKQGSVYSRRLKAGKRRTYFFDIRETKGNDFFLSITESRKRFNENGYERHKIFVYKEDFNKFQLALESAINYVKTELMPNFDFDFFSREVDTSDVPHDASHLSSRSAMKHIQNNDEQGTGQATRASFNEEDVEEREHEGQQPEETVDEDVMINATSTSDKLASEEVEKW